MQLTPSVLHRYLARAQVPCMVARFSDHLDTETTLDEQAPHVPIEEDLLGKATEQAQRRRIIEHIDHSRSAVVRLEVVVVIEASKGAPHHRVPEVVRRIEGRHSTGQFLTDPEVPRTPCHFLPRADQALGHSSDSPLTRVTGRSEVKIDASLEIEAQLRRRLDFSLDSNDRHGSSATFVGVLPCTDCEGCAVASYFREYSIVIIFISFFPPGGVPYISKVW